MEALHVTLEAMDKWKATSMILVGMILGLGYSAACNSDGDGSKGPSLGGPGVAMAQESGCAQWEVAAIAEVQMVETGAVVPSGSPDWNDSPVYRLPGGWTPLSGIGSSSLWLARCAQ